MVFHSAVSTDVYLNIAMNILYLAVFVGEKCALNPLENLLGGSENVNGQLQCSL